MKTKPMSRKHNKTQWHEPVEPVFVVVEDPLEDTIEVGEVMLVDGPLDPVPLSTGPRTTEDSKDEGDSNMTQKAQSAAQAGDKVQETAGKVQETAAKAADTVQSKAQDAAQKVGETVSAAKAKAGETEDKAKSALSKAGSAAASGAKSAGFNVWTLFQRNPLQAILVIGSVIWLIRNNQEASKEPPVSLSDAAAKAGSMAGHVQVAASNLGNQVKGQADRGAGWFSETLEKTPLAIGAMALVFGAGLGFAVPESPYEDKLLGKKRDEIVGKVQDTASDLTQKVQAVASTVVHDAVETAKEEAKNQGLTSGGDNEDTPKQSQESQDQSQSG